MAGSHNRSFQHAKKTSCKKSKSLKNRLILKPSFNILEVFEECLLTEDLEKKEILTQKLSELKHLSLWNAIVNSNNFQRFSSEMNCPGRYSNGISSTISSFEPFSSIENGQSSLFKAFTNFVKESKIHEILANYGLHSTCSSVDRSCYFSHNFFVKFNGRYYLVYEEVNRCQYYDSTNIFYDITKYVERYEQLHKGMRLVKLLDKLEIV